MKQKTAKAFVSFALRVAEEETVWADWHNRVFGIGGEFGKLFPTEKERREFMESSYRTQIDRIAEQVREGQSIEEYTVPVTTTASGRFVVRIPKTLHALLVDEAKREGVSLNQLVLAKLALRLGAASRELVTKDHVRARRR